MLNMQYVSGSGLFLHFFKNYTNRVYKEGELLQLRCIWFILVITRKNIEWRRAHYSKD